MTSLAPGWLAGHCPLPIAHCPLLIAHRSLLITHCFHLAPPSAPGLPQRRPEGPEAAFPSAAGSISGPTFDDFGRFSARLAPGALLQRLFGRFPVASRRARDKSELRFVWENAIRTRGRPFTQLLRLQRRRNSTNSPKIDPKSTENRTKIAPDRRFGPLGWRDGPRIARAARAERSRRARGAPEIAPGPPPARRLRRPRPILGPPGGAL